MIGGGNTENPNSDAPKTTELLDLNGGSKYGKPLPWKFYEHCAAKMIGQYVIIVGGFFHPTSTLIVDTWNFESMFEGPQLAGVGRTGHTCTHIKHNNGSNYVIVAGGYTLHGLFLDTSEILIINDDDVSSSRWITGKTVKR